jgi:glycosyltransferase involved in cell wall biosynthesis
VTHLSDGRRPLRVAVDGTPLLGNRTGVGHVTAELLRSLATRPDIAPVAYAVTWRGRAELQRALPRGVDSATALFPARLTRELWPRIPFPRVEWWTGPVDVVHGTNFVGPPARAPVIVTVHDLTFARFPELCTADALRYPQLIERAIDRGATIHVVSDFVGDEVRAEFGLPETRVVRVYPGLGVAPGGDPSRGRASAGRDRYVLALGAIEPRKNLPVLVRAFDQLAARDPEVALVVAGPDGWGVREFDAACAAARHHERIHRLGYVTDEARRDLLAGASVFAYPSIYEGFGHPPLEAMTNGVPVVASRAGALPEVLGDAARLVDPHDERALADALAVLLTDDRERAELVERGKTRAATFAWELAGDEFVRMYRSVG